MLKAILRYILLLLSILLIQTSYAQDALNVYGKMKLEQGRLDGKMEVTENGQRVRIINMTGSGKFEMELKLNKNYVFTFSQDGYVSKKIQVDTKILGQREDPTMPFTPFEFHVTLFKQYEGVNFVIFNQPVGKIQYDANVDDFDYDTDYTKSIRAMVEQAEKEVEEKKKEEEELIKQQEKEARDAEQAAIKKAQEEEKALLAAEAAAKKEEERLAKEEAARKREEEKLAKEAEEEKQRQEDQLAKEEAAAKRKADEAAEKEAEERRKEEERLAKEEAAKKREEERLAQQEAEEAKRKAAPVASASSEIKKEDPPTKRKKYRSPPPPTTKKPAANVVVLHSYTVGEMGYPNLSAYGFINFGDGAGRREITKEQFDEYAKIYH